MIINHRNITKGRGTLGFNPLKNIKEDGNNAGIEMYGNKRMIVLDCECVVDFSENCIVLCLGNLYMKIRGDNLMISTFAYGQTDITGEIVTIEFERV